MNNYLNNERNYFGNEIPGMIEPIEQSMLQELASNLDFKGNETAVEFGAFFGRSTACISSGLLSNDNFKSNGRFFVYDSFECHIDGAFYPHVLSHAKSKNVDGLLEIRNSKVDFFPVFQHYLRDYINSGFLFPEKAELKNSFPNGDVINLMHIDSPKFYKDFKFIFYRFFPLLREGSLIIFQDFFYHWSASLIAVCGLMLKTGYLCIESSAASSLVCRVLKPFDLEKISEFDLIMESKGAIPLLIDVACEMTSDLKLDRSEIFAPRLILAKVQWMFENGEHINAADEISSFITKRARFNMSLGFDFLELMRYGFSLERLYDQDHSD